MSYNYKIGRECSEHAAGKLWRFGRFTRKVWVELGVEARRLLPNPVKDSLDLFEAAALKDVEILRGLRAKDLEERERAKAEKRRAVLLADEFEPLSKTMVADALAASRRYLGAGSPELSGFIQSHEGCSYLLWLLMQEHQPAVTLDEAYDVYWDLASNDIDPETGRPADGRMTPHEVIRVSNGTSPEPARESAKNAECPTSTGSGSTPTQQA